jgi:hypothetical protein
VPHGPQSFEAMRQESGLICREVIVRQLPLGVGGGIARSASQEIQRRTGAARSTWRWQAR